MYRCHQSTNLQSIIYMGQHYNSTQHLYTNSYYLYCMVQTLVNTVLAPSAHGTFPYSLQVLTGIPLGLHYTPGIYTSYYSVIHSDTMKLQSTLWTGQILPCTGTSNIVSLYPHSTLLSPVGIYIPCINVNYSELWNIPCTGTPLRVLCPDLVH